MSIDANHASNRSIDSSARTRMQRPDARVREIANSWSSMARLERLEPDAPSLERYVKRQPSPSANERRMRRATTALCTSSGPS